MVTADAQLAATPGPGGAYGLDAGEHRSWCRTQTRPEVEHDLGLHGRRLLGDVHERRLLGDLPGLRRGLALRRRLFAPLPGATVLGRLPLLPVDGGGERGRVLEPVLLEGLFLTSSQTARAAIAAHDEGRRDERLAATVRAYEPAMSRTGTALVSRSNRSATR
jgi:hypothetical protein